MHSSRLGLFFALLLFSTADGLGSIRVGSPCFELLSPNIQSAIQTSVGTNLMLTPLSFFVKFSPAEERWIGGVFECSSVGADVNTTKSFAVPLVAKICPNPDRTNETTIVWYRLKKWHAFRTDTGDWIESNPSIDIWQWAAILATDDSAEQGHSQMIRGVVPFQNFFLRQLDSSSLSSFDTFRDSLGRRPPPPERWGCEAGLPGFAESAERIGRLLDGTVLDCLDEVLSKIEAACLDCPKSFRSGVDNDAWNWGNLIPLPDEYEAEIRQLFSPVGVIRNISVKISPSGLKRGMHGYVQGLCNVGGCLCKVLLLPKTLIPQSMDEEIPDVGNDQENKVIVRCDGRVLIIPIEDTAFLISF